MEKSSADDLPRRKLNPVEQQIAELFRSLYDQGLSNEDIGAAMGIGERVAKTIAFRLGVRKRSFEDDLDHVLERQFGMSIEQLLRTLLVDKHMTQSQAVDYLGVGRAWLADRAYRYGILSRGRHHG